MTQYVHRVGSLEKRLAAAGQVFKDKDKIRTILQGFTAQDFMSTDPIREPEKLHNEEVEMVVSGETYLLSFSF